MPPGYPEPVTKGQLRREIFRRITRGGEELCVVRGPFPKGFYRSLTASSPAIAAGRQKLEVYVNRTTRDDQYALVRVRDIAPLEYLGPYEI